MDFTPPVPVLCWDDPNPIFIDFETQSACDLREKGGRHYAYDPTTRILSLIAKIDGVYHVWLPLLPTDPMPEQIEQAQLSFYGIDVSKLRIYSGESVPQIFKDIEGRTAVAQNGLAFDYFLWQRFIKTSMKWADTMYLARACGLPAGLDKMAAATINERKDSAKRLIAPLWTAKWDHTKSGEVVLKYPPLLPGLVGPLLRYNMVDVVLMENLWYGPFADLSVEADVIETHVKVNFRGVQVDTNLIEQVQDISTESMAHAAREIALLTNNALVDPDTAAREKKKWKGKKEDYNGPQNFRSTHAMQAWLNKQGLRIGKIEKETGKFKPTMRKDIVEQCLADPELMLDEDSPFAAASDIPPVVFDVLRLRNSALRITGAKAERARDRVFPDSRVYDLFGYHVAHTGRESSQGIQVHNLPRPKKGIDVEKLLRVFENPTFAKRDRTQRLNIVRRLTPKGTADDALSAMIRPCLMAKPNHVLLIADFSAIECRCLAWMADETELIRIFAEGRDPYIEMAAKIFGVPVAAVTDDMRQVGKIVILGSGYSMGPEKFAIFAALSGIDLQKNGTSAEECIETFRKMFPKIAGIASGQIRGRINRRGGIWNNLNRAAMDAVTIGGVHSAGKTRWFMNGKTLLCELPSGRRLHYQNARIEDVVPGYCYALGLPLVPKATLVYSTPHGYTTGLYGGKITENVDQAICRDVYAMAKTSAERADLSPVMGVHDEVVCEVPEGEAESGLRKLVEIMRRRHSWCVDFPIDCEAYTSKRYLKKPQQGAFCYEKGHFGYLKGKKLVESLAV